MSDKGVRVLDSWSGLRLGWGDGWGFRVLGWAGTGVVLGLGLEDC